MSGFGTGMQGGYAITWKNEIASELDKLIAKHPEIMQSSGSKTDNFAWWWVDTDIYNPQTFATARPHIAAHFGNDYHIDDRRFENRRQVLVVAWRDGYLDSAPAAPAENAGARYLPSGQLIEWELDADGKPMKITVDGESVPAEFLSGATAYVSKAKGRSLWGRAVQDAINAANKQGKP